MKPGAPAPRRRRRKRRSKSSAVRVSTSPIIKSQVKAHTQTLALLHKEIASGQHADAKAFAKSILPTVRSHLKAIRAIAAERGGKLTLLKPLTYDSRPPCGGAG